MLNSFKHEICNFYKYQNSNKADFLLLKADISFVINVKMPTIVGILKYITKSNIILLI